MYVLIYVNSSALTLICSQRMWFFDLLKPYHDHVPVKADLSDLEEKIRWCRENDDKCRQIGENSKAFYAKYVARNPLLDYVEVVCKNVAKRFKEAPTWYSSPPQEQPPPQLPKPDAPCYEDRQSGTGRLCVRCQEDADKEKQELEEEEARRLAERKDKGSRKQSLRERMKKRAKTSK